MRFRQGFLLIGTVLALILQGCASSPKLKPIDISKGPPPAPATPHWVSKNGYIKTVGMLPETITWASAFWTKDNRIFVMGDQFVDSPWSGYYKAKHRDEQIKKGNYPKKDDNNVVIEKSFLPIWDPKTNQSKPLGGYGGGRKGDHDNQFVQLSTGDVLVAMVRPKRQGYYSRQILYRPEKGLSIKLPQQVLNWKHIGLQLLPIDDSKVLIVDWVGGFKRHGIPGKLRLLSWDPYLNKKTEFATISVKRLEPVYMLSDKKHLVTHTHGCVQPDGNLSSADRESTYIKCNILDLIDLEKKTSKTIGSFQGEVHVYRGGVKRKTNVGFGDYLIPLPQNRLLAFGGRDPDGNQFTQIELFDTRTGKSKVVGHLPHEILYRLLGRAPEGVVVLSDGSVVFLTNSLYLWDVHTEKFSKLDDLIVPRGEMGVTVSPDDKVYMLGGFAYRGDSRVIEMFDYKAYKQKHGKV